MNKLKDILIFIKGKFCCIKKFNIIIKLVLVIALIVIVVPFVIYKNTFDGKYSLYADDWGNFGGYYGGVVGPLLSLLSIILILITIRNQNEDSNTQIKNISLQRFEQSFNDNLIQRYSIVSTFKENSNDGFQVLKRDIYNIVEDYKKRHIDVISTIVIREKVLILNYIGLFNYIVVLAKSIETNVYENGEKEKYYTLLRYSLTESELVLLIIFKFNKNLSENYLDIIDKILGIYKDITLQNLANSENHSLYEAALMQEKIHIVLN
jgi:uncharacterized membrane protein